MDAGKRAGLVTDRLGVIRDLVAERGAPGALLTLRKNIAWATVGAEAHVVLASDRAVAGLLVTPDDAAVLTAINEGPRIRDEELDGLELDVVELPWHEADAMDAEARRRIGGGPLTDDDLEVDLLPHRCVLAPAEADRMAWLGERAREAVRAGLSVAEPGRTEHEVAAEAGRALAADGIRAPVLLVAADSRIDRYRHPLPTDHVIRRRVMLVVVAERWGLHAAVTRVAELEPPDPELSRRIEAAATVHEEMVRATAPGATLGDVLAAARGAYADVGFPDEWELHHQGGVIGYAGREAIAVPDDPTPIRAGMAFAWNPSITGAKAEETILLDATDGSPRILTA